MANRVIKRMVHLCGPHCPPQLVVYSSPSLSVCIANGIFAGTYLDMLPGDIIREVCQYAPLSFTPADPEYYQEEDY